MEQWERNIRNCETRFRSRFYRAWWLGEMEGEEWRVTPRHRAEPWGDGSNMSGSKGAGRAGDQQCWWNYTGLYLGGHVQYTGQLLIRNTGIRYKAEVIDLGILRSEAKRERVHLRREKKEEKKRLREDLDRTLGRNWRKTSQRTTISQRGRGEMGGYRRSQWKNFSSQKDGQ